MFVSSNVCSSHSLWYCMHAEIPRITNTINDKRERLVGEGSLMYTCEFEGSPLPNIKFYFNGAIISPGCRVTIFGNTLTIPSPQVNHSGIYQCIVSNEFGDDQRAWLLEIREPSEWAHFKFVSGSCIIAVNSLLCSFTTSAAIELHRTWSSWWSRCWCSHCEKQWKYYCLLCGCVGWSLSWCCMEFKWHCTRAQQHYFYVQQSLHRGWR